jgi:hypothetical protein
MELLTKKDVSEFYQRVRAKLDSKDADMLETVCQAYIKSQKERQRVLDKHKLFWTKFGTSTIKREIAARVGKDLGITAKEAMQICQIQFDL